MLNTNYLPYDDKLPSLLSHFNTALPVSVCRPIVDHIILMYHDVQQGFYQMI